MTDQEKLLNKYYKGETSLDEEQQLKHSTTDSDFSEAEQDMFAFFENESAIPDDLESSMLAGISRVNSKRKVRKMRWYSIASAAAVVAVVVSVFLHVRNEQRSKMEDNFFVMEQALFQVSQSIQPQEEEQMLVLWVDENTGIIIN